MKSIIKYENQSILDIAVLTAGSVDAVFEIIKANNSGIGLDIPLPNGAITLPDKFQSADKPRQKFISERYFNTATDTVPGVLTHWILATNFWNDNGIWIDTEFWQD
jgi:hypothetical protein